MQSDDLPEILNKINLATMSGAKQQIAKEHSITKHSILTKLPCGSWTKGCPYEFMHLIFENVIPMLICLWKGESWEVNHNNQGYVTLEATWEIIGQEVVNQSIQFIQGSAGCFLTFICIKYPSLLKHMHFGSTTSHRYYSRTDSRTTSITNMQWNSSKSSILV